MQVFMLRGPTLEGVAGPLVVGFGATPLLHVGASDVIPQALTSAFGVPPASVETIELAGEQMTDVGSLAEYVLGHGGIGLASLFAALVIARSSGKIMDPNRDGRPIATALPAAKLKHLGGFEEDRQTTLSEIAARHDTVLRSWLSAGSPIHSERLAQALEAASRAARTLEEGPHRTLLGYTSAMSALEREWTGHLDSEWQKAEQEHRRLEEENEA